MCVKKFSFAQMVFENSLKMKLFETEKVKSMAGEEFALNINAEVLVRENEERN